MATAARARALQPLTDGPRFASFCEQYVRHTKGRWAGQPFVLEPWQRAFMDEALEIDPETGLRVYSEVGLGVPRKNGKSMLASGAGLYGLAADGEAEPEVYVGASHRGQATIVLGQALRIVRTSPRLMTRLRPLAHRIDDPFSGGWMRAVASDGAGQTGLNPHWSIIDEIHAHRNADLYTALSTGTGAREQPLLLWITTWGLSTENLLASLYAQMFDGPGVREQISEYLTVYRDRANGVLTYWYGAPKHADIADPKVWKACNPASWLQDGTYLRREYGRLMSRGEEVGWRVFHLDQPVSHADAWLAEGMWERCAGESLLNPLLPIGVGIYKTAASDVAAIATAQRQGDSIAVGVKHFRATGANERVDTEAMRAHLRSLRRFYPLPAMRDAKTRMPVPGPAYAFDKWAFSESAEALEQQGLNMIDFPQYASTMGPATTATYEAIANQRLVHDGDSTLALHVANSTATLTDRGMKLQVIKEPIERRNPSAIAMVMAVAMALQEAPERRERRPRTGVGF